MLIRAARKGHFNAVYYLLTEVEGIQSKDFYSWDMHLNEYDEVSIDLIGEVERIANADRWYIPVGLVQEFTYPWFLKTIEWLEEHGEELDLPEDLSRILRIGRDDMDYIRHYTVDKDGVIQLAE